MSEPQKQTLNQKLDRVLYILENDDKTNRKGLVEEVSDMKSTLEDLLLKQKMLAGKVAFLGAVGGFVFTFGMWFYDKIIIK